MTTIARLARRGDLIVFVLYATMAFAPAEAQWPQWGGPHRNFMVEASGLADSWPQGGPIKLWKRPLGKGYSSIVYDDGILYTVYRKGKTPFAYAVALNAGDGKTIWQSKYSSPIPRETPDHPGPFSTPLVVGDRVYTMAMNAVLRCFNKADGTVLWQHDLVEEFGGHTLRNSYASSPIAYRDMVIVPAGRALEASSPGSPHDDAVRSGTLSDADEIKTGQSLLAFDQESGRVAWKNLNFKLGYSSPILIRFDGEDQLVLFTRQGLIGADPNNGNLLWFHPFPETSVDQVIMTPVWNGADRLFWCGGARQTGARMTRLTSQDERIIADEMWFGKNVCLGYPVQVGDHLVGSNGQLVIGVDVKSGRRAWSARGFESAACVYGDGKIILLDWNGQLALATATSDGLTIRAQCKITERFSMTAPTLVGTQLFVRDQEHIMALELGAPATTGKG